MVCSTASVWPVRAVPGTGNKSTNCSKVLVNCPLCEPSKSWDVWSSNPWRWSGSVNGSHDDHEGRSMTGWMAETCASMPISENGSTITVSWPKLETRTGILQPDGSTSVRPTTKPVFSANTVWHSKRPLDGIDRPPTIRVVQWSTASEYGRIKQWPTVKTRPDKAASLRCNCSDTPPSVNSSPFFMSKVCGSTEPKVSVPIIASVLKSHTRMGNSVWSPKNDTTQDEHPNMSIDEPLAPLNFLGAPARTKVW